MTAKEVTLHSMLFHLIPMVEKFVPGPLFIILYTKRNTPGILRDLSIFFSLCAKFPRNKIIIDPNHSNSHNL